jgi:hypothetical protein
MQKLIITGIVGVLIGTTAFSTKPSIFQSPQATPSPQATEPTPTAQPKNRRLTISISVAAMSDLKVTEGQTLQTGDTIATPPRTSHRKPEAECDSRLFHLGGGRANQSMY